jgi:hypothetical protein
MWRKIKLSDIERALVLNNCSLVVIYVEVIRRGKEGHERWEIRFGRFTIHAIPEMCKPFKDCGHRRHELNPAS